VNRRGFSLVELLITIAILGILVNLALPAVSHLRRRAQAAQVVGDFQAIRVAGLDRYIADGAYPPLESYAKVPPKLVGGLPKGFAFRYGKLEYRWITFTWKGDGKGKDKDDDKGKGDGKGKDDGKQQFTIAGVGIRGDKDKKLMAAIRAAYRGPIIFLSSTEFILMIE
jgi:prepilin-type N-terminal cleavage/methylation domain-containing protein